MALSKRLRYEILRRDNHACRYCGATAPAAELTVDHVTPVSLGGTDDPANLVTACRDCNAGKSAASPDASLVADVSADALRWGRATREAAELLLRDQERRAGLLRAFLDAWENWTYGPDNKHFPLPLDWETSVGSLLGAGLPVELLCECVDLAMGQKYVKDEFRYMCGIAWRKVASIREIAAALLETDAGE